MILTTTQFERIVREDARNEVIVKKLNDLFNMDEMTCPNCRNRMTKNRHQDSWECKNCGWHDVLFRQINSGRSSPASGLPSHEQR